MSIRQYIIHYTRQTGRNDVVQEEMTIAAYDAADALVQAEVYLKDKVAGYGWGDEKPSWRIRSLAPVTVEGEPE